MRNLAIDDMAARFNHFKPIQVMQRLSGLSNSLLDGVVATDR